jgi:hypothetical protein
MVNYAAVPSYAGDGRYEAHVADLHTMLATWHWYV